MTCEKKCEQLALQLITPPEPVVIPPAQPVVKNPPEAEDKDLAAGVVVPDSGVDFDSGSTVSDIDLNDKSIEELDQIIAEETAAIYDQIMDGDAFVNPSEEDNLIAIGAADDFLANNTSSSLLSLANAQYAANPVGPAPTLGLFDDLLSEIGNVRNVLNQFLAHTRLLSGFNFGLDSNLSSILRTVLASRKASGFAGCGLTGKIFSAIVKAQEFIADMQKFVGDIQRLLGNIMGLINDFRSFVNNFAQKMLTAMTDYLVEFARMQLALLIDSFAGGISGFFEDECLGDIVKGIANNKLKEGVSKVNAAKNAKIRAINSRIPKI